MRWRWWPRRFFARSSTFREGSSLRVVCTDRVPMVLSASQPRRTSFFRPGGDPRDRSSWGGRKWPVALYIGMAARGFRVVCAIAVTGNRPRHSGVVVMSGGCGGGGCCGADRSSAGSRLLRPFPKRTLYGVRVLSEGVGGSSRFSGEMLPGQHRLRLRGGRLTVIVRPILWPPEARSRVTSPRRVPPDRRVVASGRDGKSAGNRKTGLK